MPSLKGLACVSLFTLAIAAPAFAQTNDGSTPPSRPPTISPANPSTAPGDQQTAPRKHHRRSRKSSTTQGQPASPSP